MCSTSEDKSVACSTSCIGECGSECNDDAVPHAGPHCSNTVKGLRISARVQNKQRRGEEKTDADTAKHRYKKLDLSDDDDDIDGSSIKRRRQWELWSAEDKDVFFEAINECGKSFASIQSFLSAKLRKKGSSGYQIKNRDQVRHFYYRTWHKIAKYISYNGVAKKSTQEVYGLVNYGEFRRRVGGILDSRRGLKLRELVLHGTTSLRLKGRTIRIRTPLCRALKKFSQSYECGSGRRLPVRVQVQASPATTAAWAHVQALAHNPRVRVPLLLNRQLSDLLQHLRDKWRPTDFKVCDTLVASTHLPLTVPKVSEPVLRLRPPSSAPVTLARVSQHDAERPFYASLLSFETALEDASHGSSLSRSTRQQLSRKHIKNEAQYPGVHVDAEPVPDQHPDGAELSQEDTEDSGDDLFCDDRVSRADAGYAYPTSEEECAFNLECNAIGNKENIIEQAATIIIDSVQTNCESASNNSSVRLRENVENSREKNYDLTKLQKNNNLNTSNQHSFSINCDVDNCDNDLDLEIELFSIKNRAEHSGCDDSDNNLIRSRLVDSSISGLSSKERKSRLKSPNNLTCTAQHQTHRNLSDTSSATQSSTLPSSEVNSNHATATLKSQLTPEDSTNVHKKVHIHIKNCSNATHSEGQTVKGARGSASHASAGSSTGLEGAGDVPVRRGHKNAAKQTCLHDDEEEDAEDDEEEMEEVEEEDEEEVEELEETEDEDEDEEDDEGDNFEDDHLYDDIENEDEKEVKLLEEDKVDIEEKKVLPEELERSIASIRRGWTLDTVGRLTIGQLYIMLGQQDPLHLEYEFEDKQTTVKEETIKKEETELETSTEMKLSVSSSSEVVPAASEGKGSSLAHFDQLPKSIASPPLKKVVRFTCSSSSPSQMTSSEAQVTQANPDTKEGLVSNNLSGMLSQLLSMSRQLFQNKSLSVESGVCICGASKGPRSPRSSVGGRSPRATSLPASSSVHHERIKPTSAKRLIGPDCASEDKCNYQAGSPLLNAGSASATGRHDVVPSSLPSTGVPDSRLLQPIKAEHPTHEPILPVLPRYSSRSIRPRTGTRKNMVVQRQLPLLPKQPPQLRLTAASRQHHRTMHPKPLLLPPYTKHQGVFVAPSLANAISVNVSGKQLLTVQLPHHTPDPLPPDTSYKLVCNNVARVISVATAPVTRVTNTDTSASSVSLLAAPPSSNTTRPADLLDHFLSKSVLDELNTPPVTPAPPDMGGSSFSAVSLDGSSCLSKGCLSTPLHTVTYKSTQVVLPDPDTASNSLLNTPKLRTCNSTSPDIHVLHSATKNITNLLASSDAPSLPQLHIPDDDSVHLPLLDISLSASFGIDDSKVQVKDATLAPPVTYEVTDVTTMDVTTLTLSPTVTSFENIGKAIEALPQTHNKHVTCSNQTLHQSMQQENISHLKQREVESNVSTSAAVSIVMSNSSDTPFCTTLATTAAGTIHFKSQVPMKTHVRAHSRGAIPTVSVSCFSLPESNLNESARPRDLDQQPLCKVARSEALFTTLSPTVMARALKSDHDSDRMFDITLANSNSNSSFSSLLAAVASPNHDSVCSLNTPPRRALPHPSPAFPTSYCQPSPPSSPSRLIPREEQQWLAGEVADFSLTSLLGSLDSPSKSGAVYSSGASTAPVVVAGPGVASGVGPALFAALSENGVDYTASFGARAAERR